MAANAPTGFRRDLKLFLGGLIGFLAFIIVALVVLLSRIERDTEAMTVQQANTIADAAVRQLCEQPAQRVDDAALTTIRLPLNIAGITLARPRMPELVSGVAHGADNTLTIPRQSCRGPLYFVFDAADMNTMRRRTMFAGAICIAAAGVGTLLLLLYLPRIVGPIEQLLDEATKVGRRREGEDEAQYLIATFRSSIARLQEQEADLRRQHEREKSRADTLDRISKTLTRSMTSGLIALNADGLVVTVNGAAADILGITAADDLQPTSVTDLLGDSDFARTLRDAFARRATVSRVEVPHDQRVVGLTTVPLVSETDVVFGMLALFTDLTSIRELESRVRDMRTFADLGEVSAGIAHEFRNSLSTVLGYLRLLRRSDLSADSLGQVQRAENEVNALAEAVEALLRFARPMRLDTQRVDVRELVEATVARLQAPELAIEWSIDGDAIDVDGDRTLLSRALENILRNAIDAVRAAPQPRIAITIGSRGANAVLRIEDSGIGIDAKDVPRLFLPFQSDKPTGFGLGLPLAKKIVLLHGGTVTLAPGAAGGAVATIELPRAQE